MCCGGVQCVFVALTVQTGATWQRGPRRGAALRSAACVSSPPLPLQMVTASLRHALFLTHAIRARFMFPVDTSDRGHDPEEAPVIDRARNEDDTQQIFSASDAKRQRTVVVLVAVVSATLRSGTAGRLSQLPEPRCKKRWIYELSAAAKSHPQTRQVSVANTKPDKNIDNLANKYVTTRRKVLSTQPRSNLAAEGCNSWLVGIDVSSHADRKSDF